MDGRVDVGAGVHVRLHQDRAFPVTMMRGDVGHLDGRELRPRRHPIAPRLREVDESRHPFRPRVSTASPPCRAAARSCWRA